MTDDTTDPRHAHREEGFPAQHHESAGPDRTDPPGTGPRRTHLRRPWSSGGTPRPHHGRRLGHRTSRRESPSHGKGADVAIAHLPEEQDDAEDTLALVRETGRAGVGFAGDLRDETFATDIVARTRRELGGLDVLVLNAGYQHDIDGFETLETERMRRVFDTNLAGMLFSARAAYPDLPPGASIIVTASVQAYNPSPGLIDYAMTKAAQVAFVKAPRGRGGPAGHPRQRRRTRPDLDAADPGDRMGRRTAGDLRCRHPAGRAGQPAELAGTYVYLASAESSYTSGSVIAVNRPASPSDPRRGGGARRGPPPKLVWCRSPPRPAPSWGSHLVIGSCSLFPSGPRSPLSCSRFWGPGGVTSLRVAIAAVLLGRHRAAAAAEVDPPAVVGRRALRRLPRRDERLLLCAIDRIPLGPAVAIEFLGPLVLAAVLTRKLSDFTWVGVALLGMVVLGIDGLIGAEPRSTRSGWCSSSSPPASGPCTSG